MSARLENPRSERAIFFIIPQKTANLDPRYLEFGGGRGIFGLLARAPSACLYYTTERKLRFLPL